MIEQQATCSSHRRRRGFGSGAHAGTRLVGEATGGEAAQRVASCDGRAPGAEAHAAGALQAHGGKGNHGMCHGHALEGRGRNAPREAACLAGELYGGLTHAHPGEGYEMLKRASTVVKQYRARVAR